MWLDIEHTDNKKYFTWDSRAFPNPKAMQNKLAMKGRKVGDGWMGGGLTDWWVGCSLLFRSLFPFFYLFIYLFFTFSFFSFSPSPFFISIFFLLLLFLLMLFSSSKLKVAQGPETDRKTRKAQEDNKISGKANAKGEKLR